MTNTRESTTAKVRAMVGADRTHLPIGNDGTEVPAGAEVIFPYDGVAFARAPVASVEFADQALEHAVSAAPELAASTRHQRRATLESVKHGLLAAQQEFVDLLVLETGKPLRDCEVEFARAVVVLEATTDELSRSVGETVPLDLQESGRGMVGFWTRRPIGVVVAITGFNYPLLLAMHKLAPAFASGCPVIAKPAPQTPLTTLWLVDLFRSAASDVGLSPRSVQLVTGDADVGRCLVADPRVAAVTFTGSAHVGHLIARQAAPRKVMLELGSNAPLIVADDADLDGAARAIVRGGYYASGQACISVQRVIADERIADELHERVVALVGDVRVGDPRDPATATSALIDEPSTRRVLDWVDEAVRRGAEVTAGNELDGRCIRPTLLRAVPRDCLAWQEEIFGPVVAFRGVSGFAEALELANDSRYGLHASVFTSSLDRAMQAYDVLAYGGVVVNEVPGFRSDYMPYGGVKDSGVGREGPRFAMHAMTTERMAIIRVQPGP